MVDHLRAKKPHVSLSADSDEGFELANTLAIDSGFGPLQQVEHRQQAQALLDALAALPDVQRETFLMQAEAGMSLAEIAEAMGTNTETVKSRLRYARQKLRQSLEAIA
jgi:RNA polymerase sigma-70 factor (ECF subfamily)